MIGPNKVVIATAGSGKTTYLVREALKVKDDSVLITTYTESNEAEIKKRIFDLNGGHIPPNIVVMTWFTFLPLLKFEWVQFPGQGRAQPGEANP